MNPYSRLFTRSLVFGLLMFNADKGGASGGAAAKTDLEKLQDAEAEAKTLKQQLADANAAKTKAETEKTNAETAKKTAEDQLATANQDKGELQEKLTKAEGEVKKLQGESKTTDQRAQEIAAAHGSAGARKDPEAASGNGEKSGQELYEAYSKLNGLEAAEFWKKHSKALIAYGEEAERKARRRSDED